MQVTAEMLLPVVALFRVRLLMMTSFAILVELELNRLLFVLLSVLCAFTELEEFW